MLVLRRQPGESVRIGEDIEITILEVKGAGVKIGIAAPQDVGIYRSELERINRRAASEWLQNKGLESFAEKLRNKTPSG